MPTFNASGPCGPSRSVCQNGGTCLPLQPEPEPEPENWTASWLGDEEDGQVRHIYSLPLVFTYKT